MSLETRLGDLEEMQASGLLTEQEFELEKERLLGACANAGTDIDQIYNHKEEWEDYVDAENYTIARRANNNLARSMAYGEPEINDMSARGVRLNGAVDFSDDEFGRMRRGEAREMLEREAGLKQGDLRDMRSTWCSAAHSLYVELCDASPQGQPLTEMSFRAKRDLAAGDVVTVSLRNYTRKVDALWTPETDAVGLAVESSPFGKITSAIWGQRLRLLNLTIAQPVFQDEPIRVFFNNESGIRQDLSSEDTTMSAFMDMLFSRKLPALSDDTLQDASATSLPTTGPAFQPRDELAVCGLQASPELNGKRVRVISRSEERCKVEVLETGRKVLLRHRNLQRIEGDDGPGLVREAAETINKLYTLARNQTHALENVDLDQNSGERARKKHDSTLGRLSDQDVRDLAALNISAEGGELSWQTSHYDGGMGRFVVTPFTDDDDLFVSSYVRGKRNKERPPAAAKQLLLDYYLQVASMEGNADRLESLIQAGANITTTRFPGTYHGDNDRMPVHVATYEEKADALRALLYHGADANARDGNLATPLHLAAIKGNTEVVQVLLDAGGDPTLLNYWNRSCIHRAIFYGRQEASQMMMEAAGSRCDMDEIRDIARLEGVDETVAKNWAYLD